MRAGVARRALEQVGDVTYVLLDEHVADRPEARLDPTVVVVPRRSPGVRHRWPALGAALGGRGRVPDAVAAGRWDLPPELMSAPFDLGWFVKTGALLAWPGPMPTRVVLDVDDLEEDTRSGGPVRGVVDRVTTRGLRSRLARETDLLVVCSAADRDRLPPAARAAIVPNAAPGVTAPVGPPPTDANLLFVGVLGYPPNREGLIWFARNVLPRLRAVVPDVRVRAVGPQGDLLPEDVRDVIDAVGPVADLAPHYAWARAVIVPVLVGSGTRVKILDAFAHGRGLVTTTIGAAGLDLRPGVDAELADGPDAFAAACLDALAPGRAEALAAAGADLARTRMSSVAAERQVAAAAGSLLRRDPPRIFVEVTSARARGGRPDGIARVEAGLARGLAELGHDAPTVWVDADGLHVEPTGDLGRYDDGTQPEPSARLGLLRQRVVQAAGSVSPRVGGVVADVVEAVLAVREPGRRRRVGQGLHAAMRPRDVLLVAGHDWTTGVVAAVADLPPRRRPRLWVVVHDLVPLTHPSTTDAGAPALFRPWLADVATHAEGILVISQATADAIDAASDLGLLPRPRRMVVVRPAVEVAAVPHAPRGVESLPRPFVVQVGTIETRKNHRLLVDVIRRAAASGETMPTIVWVGAWGWGTADLRDAVDRDPVLRSGIVHLPGLTDAELRWILDNAAALVLPSVAEGYGLPVAEARSIGLPVIAADLAAVREAADGIGTFLHPDDADAWRAALREVAQTPPPRDTPAQARTWADVAHEVVAAIDGQGGGLSGEPPT